MISFGPSRTHAIPETEEFRRIVALPRRRTPSPDELEKLAEQMTNILKTPTGNMRLRPIQALALYESGKYDGLFGPIRVGGGKTLLSLLLPFVAGLRRAILLLPAALRDKTEKERLKLAKHWRVARDLRIISYEELGRAGGENLLTFYAPDGILADEAHRLKNKKAAVTRRVARYMREHPETKFFAFSGTMLGGGTIKTFAHILKWTHKDRAPIPLHDGELEEFASAIDESNTNFSRPHPGALLKLATSPEDVVPGDDIRTARRGFQRRLLETPGVVSTAGEQVSCSLYVRALMYKPNAATEDNFERLRGNKAKQYPGWQTPDGWSLSMAAEVSAKARELALGFHGVWDPRPPTEWLFARKEWAAFVREVISRSRSLDSELVIANACARGDLDDRAYRAWQEVRPTFRINQKDVWHDDSALNVCAKWMADGPGVVWVKHVFFGDELERRTGAPYFRQEGRNKAGQSLETFSELVKEGKQKSIPIIASIDACSTGFNLQPWNRNLLTWFPSEAKTIEQLLGRTHRDGQRSDQVEADVLVACIEHFDAWQNARAKAQMAVDTLGDSQKILIADVIGFPDELDIARMGGARWTKARRVTCDDE